MTLPPGIAAGAFPGSCANMAYLPRSRPNFPGDIQHDFRDFMLDNRLDTLAEWQGKAAEVWLCTARLTDRIGDPISVCLAEDAIFDARTLWIAHDHMAAHWRAAHMQEAMTGREKITGPEDRPLYCRSYAGLLFRFRRYLRRQIDVWSAIKPDLLHLFLLAVTAEHTKSGRIVEMELHIVLADLYPVPGQNLPKSLAP